MDSSVTSLPQNDKRKSLPQNAPHTHHREATFTPVRSQETSRTSTTSRTSRTSRTYRSPITVHCSPSALCLTPLAFRSLPFAHPREPVRGDEAISGNLFHLKRNDVPLALAKLNPDKPDLFAPALILLPVALLF